MAALGVVRSVSDPSRDGVSDTEFSADHGRAVTEAATLGAGDQVGRYRVLERVGHGGMGVVYAAYDPELDRRIALKLLRRPGADNKGRRGARLLREAQALARLSHPNVITVHDVGDFGGRVFLAMEFVEGQTLKAWMDERRRSWKELQPVFVAAGRGLAAAHAVGLVHRDFKPANVLLGMDGRVRVTDFGLAHFASGETSSGSDASVPLLSDGTPSDGGGLGLARAPLEPLTRSGALVGTPAYMAPEQYQQAPATPAADQFSFCITLFEALYGHRPFPGRTLIELAANMSAGRVEVPSDVKVPKSVVRAVMRGLEQDPRNRFGHINELLAILRRRRVVRVGWWATVIGLPAAALAVGLWPQERKETPAPDHCRTGGMDTVWNADRRAAVGQAFADTELPYAHAVADAAFKRLDAYSAMWTSRRRHVCARSELPDTRREDLIEGYCLVEQRARVDALLEVFAAADRAVVDRAISATEALTPPSACAGRATNGAPEPPTGSQEVVAEAREQLARAGALRSAGRFATALELAQTVDLRASRLEYPTLAAETKLELGRVQLKLGEHQAALASLEDAIWLGVEGRARRVTAAAWIELVFVHAARLRDAKAARRAMRGARAELDGIGDAPALERRLLNYSASVALVERDFEEAKRIYEQVLARYPDDTTARRAALLVNLASVEADLLHMDRAVENLHQAIGLFVEHYGPVHPRVALAHYNLGVVLLRASRLDDALASLRHAYQIESQTLGDHHPRHAKTAAAIGTTLLRTAAFADAAEAMRDALAIAGTPTPERAPEINSYSATLVICLIELGRLDDAQHEVAESRRVLDRLEGVPPQAEVSWRAAAARLARAKGDPKGAGEHARAGLATAREAPYRTDPQEVAMLELELAYAEADSSGPKAAAQRLERLLQGDAVRSLDKAELAEVMFHRARYLHRAGDEQAALELAEEARRTLVAIGDDAGAAELEGWIASPGLRRRRRR